jgi:hypothetical protein
MQAGRQIEHGDQLHRLGGRSIPTCCAGSRSSGSISDIRYIPVAKGFLCVVLIMDWVSRAVLAWRLSNTLGADSVSFDPSAYRDR